LKIPNSAKASPIYLYKIVEVGAPSVLLPSTLLVPYDLITPKLVAQPVVFPLTVESPIRIVAPGPRTVAVIEPVPPVSVPLKSMPLDPFSTRTRSSMTLALPLPVGLTKMPN
jgi:hypothetical protein